MHPLRGFIGSNLFSENVAFSSEYEVNSGVFQTSVLLFWLLMWWQEASLLHNECWRQVRFGEWGTLGLIYNRCVCTQQALKEVY